jgi:hypothetical protein
MVPDPDAPTTQEERVIRALAAWFDPNNQEELPDFSLDEELVRAEARWGDDWFGVLSESYFYAPTWEVNDTYPLQTLRSGTKGFPSWRFDEETEEFTASTAIVLRQIKLGRRLA